MEKIYKSNDSKSIGICLGATTLSIVELSKKENKLSIDNIVIKQHEGDPKNALASFFEKNNLSGKYLGLTGRKFRHFTNIPSITEPEATEIAYQFINKNKTHYDAIVSAGGETFIVYEIDKYGKIMRDQFRKQMCFRNRRIFFAADP